MNRDYKTLSFVNINCGVCKENYLQEIDSNIENIKKDYSAYISSLHEFLGCEKEQFCFSSHFLKFVFYRYPIIMECINAHDYSDAHRDFVMMTVTNYLKKEIGIC